MTRGKAILLAPHASRLHSLMTFGHPPAVAYFIFAGLIAFIIWTVTAVNPRRSR